MILLCPVRPGDRNEELRYAARSWETNLILGDLTLVTIGHRPDWLSPDHHIEGNRYKSMPLAVWDNVSLGADYALSTGAEEVVYMNDDFFCMDPTGSILPVRRDCSLAEHIAKFHPRASAWWPASLRLTAEFLADEGIIDPPSYEVHRPLLASPEGMVKALARWDQTAHDLVPQWRTVYGALNHVDAYPAVDAKLSTGQRGVGTPWLSTSDESWRRFAAPLTKRFQKPSRWER